jgi:hypothetical protein
VLLRKTKSATEWRGPSDEGQTVRLKAIEMRSALP